MKKINCILLFPQLQSTLLVNRNTKIKFLNYYNFIINELLEIIDVFCVKKSIILFDSHVGDTLCQIRAYKNLLLFKNKISILNIEKSNIKVFIKRLSEIINLFNYNIKNAGSNYNKLLDCSISIKDFINKNDLNLYISENLYYLFLNKFLTKFSIRGNYNIPISINYDEIKNKLAIGKAAAHNIVKFYQSILTKISCDFINELLDDLPDLIYIKKIFLFLLLSDKQKRYVLPCFDVTKIILEHIKLKEYHVCLVFEDNNKKNNELVNILFKYKKQNNKFICIHNIDECKSINDSDVCLVILGESDIFNKIKNDQEKLIKFISSFNIEEICLGNMAFHPQYSADEFEGFKLNPYLISKVNSENFDHAKINKIFHQKIIELKLMQNIAIKNGYCSINKKIFLLNIFFVIQLQIKF